MPRPKRTKITHATPSTRVVERVPQNPPQSDPKTTENAIDQFCNVSDGEDQAFATVRRVTGIARRTPKEQTNVTGKQAISKGTATATQRHELSEAEKNFIARTSNNLDFDDVCDGSSSLATEVGRRNGRIPGRYNSITSIGNLRRRPRQPSVLGRGAGKARSSSVESALAETNGLSTIGNRNRSAMVAAIAREHAREPSLSSEESLLGSSPDNHLRTSMPAQVGSALRLANTFKPRERQPSILGTSRKAQQPRPAYQDEENDFDPEDQSTPLNFSRTRIMATSSLARTSNPRKRKLSPHHAPRSRTRTFEESDASRRTPDIAGNEDDHDPSLLSLARSPNTPVLSSASRSAPSSPSLPSLHQVANQSSTAQRSPTTRTQRDRTPLPQDISSLPSSPPSLTHSPNYPTRKRGRPSAPPRTNLSTAQLQALLPRRRRRQAAPPPDLFTLQPSSDAEVDATGLGSDEDELSHLDARARPHRPAPTSIIPKPKAQTKRGPKPKNKPTRPNKSTKKRTYGSLHTAAASDKENHGANTDGENYPGDSLAPVRDDKLAGGERSEKSDELEATVGIELKRAQRKFREVDKWELEFEEMEGSSSF